ncbi:hypothetical protein VNI00_004413, partial [Paramarasmius palmivorus]
DVSSTLVSGVPRALCIYRDTYQEAVDVFITAVLRGQTEVVVIPYSRRPDVQTAPTAYMYPGF